MNRITNTLTTLSKLSSLLPKTVQQRNTAINDKFLKTLNEFQRSKCEETLKRLTVYFQNGAKCSAFFDSNISTLIHFGCPKIMSHFLTKLPKKHPNLSQETFNSLLKFCSKTDRSSLLSKHFKGNGFGTFLPQKKPN